MRKVFLLFLLLTASSCWALMISAVTVTAMRNKREWMAVRRPQSRTQDASEKASHCKGIASSAIVSARK